jgi:hypothetical protein
VRSPWFKGCASAANTLAFMLAGRGGTRVAIVGC